MIKRLINPFIGGMIVIFILTIVHLMVDNPILLAERFFPRFGGWIEILLIALYAGIIIDRMTQGRNVSYWRRFT